jgi:hypothetical protein
MRSDREYRGTGAVGVVQPVDQVQVARSGASRAYRQLAGYLRLGGGSERSALLVAHVHPIDAFGAAHSVDYRVEAVPDDAVYAPHPAIAKDADHLLGHGFHDLPPSAEHIRSDLALAPTHLPESPAASHVSNALDAEKACIECMDCR